MLLVQDTNAFVRWMVPKLLPLLLQPPHVPRIQRRLFFGAPLPPLDPAFSLREPGRKRVRELQPRPDVAASVAHRIGGL